jgi:hypothetical protein
VPRLGPSAREQLRDAGINHLDSTGVCFLHLPGIRLDRQRPTIPRADRVTRPLTGDRDARDINPFSKKASRVLRLLFSVGRAPLRITEIAARADVAVGWASDVAQTLVQRGYAERTAKGVRLVDPVKALQDWMPHYSWRKNPRRWFAIPFPPDEALDRFRVAADAAKLPWALALLFAARRRVGFVRGEDVLAIYAPGDAPRQMRAVLQAMYAEESSIEGSLVVLEPYHGRAVIDERTMMRGCPVVSDLQLLLDLAQYPLRGPEAAEVLVMQRIAPAFQLDRSSVQRLLQSLA